MFWSLQLVDKKGLRIKHQKMHYYLIKSTCNHHTNKEKKQNQKDREKIFETSIHSKEKL